MMLQQYCAKCGSLVGERSRFCAACGSNLIQPGSVTAVPSSAIAPPPTNSAVAPPSASQPPLPPATPNPFASYSPAANPTANPFASYNQAANPTANPFADYDPATNPAATNPYSGYGAAMNQPAAPYLPGYDRAANPAAYGGNPMPGVGNPYGDPTLTPATYYGAGAAPPAPRRSWALYAAVIAPILLLAIVLIFYFVLSNFARLQFGQVSSAIGGNGIVDPGCHFTASGSGLRGELSAAIDTMCHTQSFHIVMDGKLNGQSISVSGNFRRGAGEFDASAIGITYHGIIIGNDAYISTDGKRWLKDSSSQVHNVALFAALFDMIPSDFSDGLQDKGIETMLGGEKAHKIGATGGGSGTIIGPGASGSVTFWVVDANGAKAVRHLQMNVAMSSVSGNMDMEYTNFNVPVNVSAPQVDGDSGSSLGNPGYGNSSAPSFKQVVPTLGP